jgi:hypothetical protein
MGGNSGLTAAGYSRNCRVRDIRFANPNCERRCSLRALGRLLSALGAAQRIGGHFTETLTILVRETAEVGRQQTVYEGK